ncbi:MAG: hypothetical protein J7L54_02050 [Elusimicrobia bacterium]|nr:hypothetical protein [Elusimicrobiota bacterium]
MDLVAYWVVVFLLAVLLVVDVTSAIKDYEHKKNLPAFIFRLLLLWTLLFVIINALSRILALDFEIPFVP